MPIDGGRAVMPVKDELVDVHAFSGEGIATFECTVMAVSRIPFEYVVLSPPRRIKNRALRKSLRVRSNVVGKMLGSRNKINNIKATFEAIKMLRPPRPPRPAAAQPAESAPVAVDQSAEQIKP